jgi:hypothetical protein
VPEVTLKNGEVLLDGKFRGLIRKSFRYGYHPMAEVMVEGKTGWFELDDPDLVQKAVDFARQALQLKKEGTEHGI